MLSHVNPILTLVLAVYLVVQPTTQAAAGPIHVSSPINCRTLEPPLNAPRQTGSPSAWPRARIRLRPASPAAARAHRAHPASPAPTGPPVSTESRVPPASAPVTPCRRPLRPRPLHRRPPRPRPRRPPTRASRPPRPGPLLELRRRLSHRAMDRLLSTGRALGVQFSHSLPWWLKSSCELGGAI